MLFFDAPVEKGAINEYCTLFLKKIAGKWSADLCFSVYIDGFHCMDSSLARGLHYLRLSG